MKAKIEMKVYLEPGEEEEVEIPTETPLEEKAVPENKWDVILQQCEDVALEFPFTIIEEKMLQAIVKDIQTFRIRIFIISAQNLTAQSS